MSVKPYPDLMLGSLYELTPDILTERSVKLLLMDLDNTMAKYGASGPDFQLCTYVEALKAAGIEPFIFSNSHGERAKNMASALHLDYISRAKKPNTDNLLAVLAKKGVSTEHAAIVGDQIYKDVLCGKRAGVFAVCIQPISLKNPFRFLRYVGELPYRKVK